MQLVKLALASCLENRSLKVGWNIELRLMPLSISFATGCSVNGVRFKVAATHLLHNEKKIEFLLAFLLHSKLHCFKYQ